MRAAATWLRQALPCTRPEADTGAGTAGPSTATPPTTPPPTPSRVATGTTANTTTPALPGARRQRHERNFFPEWRQAPRTPRDAVAELMHLVRGLPGPEAAGLLKQLRDGWMSGEALPALLQQAHPQLQAFPAAQSIVSDLCREAGAAHLETELHFNPYGRTFESQAVAALVADPPAAVLATAGLVARRLAGFTAGLAPDVAARAAQALHQRLWADVRPWFNQCLPLQHYMSGDHPGPLHLQRLLKNLASASVPGQPGSGTAAIGLAHCAARLTWALLEATGSRPPWMDRHVRLLLNARDAVGRSLPAVVDRERAQPTSGTGLYLPGQPGFVAEPPPDMVTPIEADDWSQAWGLDNDAGEVIDPRTRMGPFAAQGLEHQFPGACGVSGSAMVGLGLMLRHAPNGSPIEQRPQDLAQARHMALLFVMHLVHDGGHSMREVMAAVQLRLALPPGSDTPDAPRWQNRLPRSLAAWARQGRIEGHARTLIDAATFSYADVLDLAGDEPTRQAVASAFDGALDRVMDQVASGASCLPQHREAWEAASASTSAG